MKLLLREAVSEGEKIVKPEVTLSYGNFVQTVVDFLIVAFSIFMVVKLINKMRKKFEREKEKADAVIAQESVVNNVITELDLLTEIRDLLKNDVNKNE
jgi:large conductance mechanosensitive channel